MTTAPILLTCDHSGHFVDKLVPFLDELGRVVGEEWFHGGEEGAEVEPLSQADPPHSLPLL